MRKYGKHYVVCQQVSRHSSYELNSEARVDMYGTYTSLSEARKALKNCASIAEKDWHCTGEVACCRIVDEPDTVIIVKDWITEGHGDLTHNPKMITIRIEREP